MVNVTQEDSEVQVGTARPVLTVSATFTQQLPPVELRARRQWVAFKLEPRPGQPKPAKVPYKATDQRAKTTDPVDWLTYEAAVALAEQPGLGASASCSRPRTGWRGLTLTACATRTRASSPLGRGRSFASSPLTRRCHPPVLAYVPVVSLDATG
jgi:hypothetical protein